MNRKASSLISLGISMALIAAVIWFLSYLYATPWGRMDGWQVSRHGYMMGGGGMGIIMLIFWILVFGAVALLISGAVTNRRSAVGTGAGDYSLEILKQRYARGEIDRETYASMKQDLLQ